jgi:hypothetical protein
MLRDALGSLSSGLKKEVGQSVSYFKAEVLSQAGGLNKLKDW